MTPIAKKQKNNAEKNPSALQLLVQQERACFTEKKSSLSLEYQTYFSRYAEIENQIRQLEKEKRVCFRQMYETKNLIEQIQSNTVDFLQYFFQGALLLATVHRNTEVLVSSSTTSLFWSGNELSLLDSIDLLEEKKEEELKNSLASKISGTLCEKQKQTASPALCLSSLAPPCPGLPKKRAAAILRSESAPQICETSIICNFSAILDDFLLSQTYVTVDSEGYILETIQKLKKAASLIIGLLEDNRWKLPGFVSICRFFFSFERPNDILVYRIYYLLPELTSVGFFSEPSDERTHEKRGCIEFDYMTGDLFFIQTATILCFNAQKWKKNQRTKLFRLFHWKGTKKHFWSEEPTWTYKKKNKKFFEEAPFCPREARQWTQAFQKVASIIENIANSRTKFPLVPSFLSPCLIGFAKNQKTKKTSGTRSLLRQNKTETADSSWPKLRFETKTKVQDFLEQEKGNPKPFRANVLSRRELRNNRINLRKQGLS